MDFITFANNARQEIFNTISAIDLVLKQGRLENIGDYKMSSGKILGLSMAEAILAEMAKQWLAGNAKEVMVPKGYPRVEPITLGAIEAVQTIKSEIA